MFEFQLSKDIKRRRVNILDKQSIEPQEVFLDALAQKNEEQIGISEKKLEVPLSPKTIVGFYAVFLLVVLAFLGITFRYQIIQGKDFLVQAQRNNYAIKLIQATRGVIYDSDMKQMVFNQSSFDLIFKGADFPGDKPEEENILKEASSIIEQDLDELKGKIKASSNQGERIVVAENLDNEKVILLQAKIAAKELPGFSVENTYVRDYPLGTAFSHLLGYTGKITQEELKSSKNSTIFDIVGREGIEKSYEDVLKIKPGKIKIIRDAIGREISEEVVVLPEAGKSLVLNLNAELQKKLEEALENTLKNVNAKKAAAVAVDPKTGGVLAMVSYPNYDNNLFAKGISQADFGKLINDPQKPLLNRALAGGFQTGSAIKPFEAAAALQEKIISPDKQINDTGVIEIKSVYDPAVSWTYTGIVPHGWVDMRKAIAVSSNIYFYTIGGGFGDQQGLGPTRIKKYLELFGWGNSAGIDLPGAFDGFIPSPEWKKQVKKENWWDGDTYHLAIGQAGIMISPLQVVMAYTAIANGGVLYRPQMVQKIINASGGPAQVEKVFESTIVRQNFIDSQNLQVAREGMRQAVTDVEGSSHLLNSLPVSSASKTGTAQSSKKDHFTNWVNVFAPYDNPQIVLTVVIEDVPGLQSAAVPVAKDVLEWYFTK